MTFLPTHRHKKRGTTYEVFGRATLESAAPIHEGAELTIYRDQGGKLWARPADEFHDGRFQTVRAPEGYGAPGSPDPEVHAPDYVPREPLTGEAT